MDSNLNTLQTHILTLRLAKQYHEAADKPAFLADIWGDLTHAEGTALLEQIRKQEARQC